jgi:hypothetical protein
MALVLLVFALLYAHDRVVTAKLAKEKIVASLLQTNNNDLAAKLDRQTAMVARLNADSVAYRNQSALSMRAADALRAARKSDETRIAALSVPKPCTEALNYLVQYWQSQSPAARRP